MSLGGGSEKDEFYLVLPSNAAPKTFPHNVPHHFYTPLSQPLFLEDPTQWKVSLRELTYQNTIQTIIDEGVEVWNDALGELEEMDRVDYDAHSSKYLTNVFSTDDEAHEYHLDENAIASAGYLLREGIVVRVERSGVKIKENTLTDASPSITFVVTAHPNEKLIILGKRKTTLLRTVHPKPGYYATEEKLCEELNRVLHTTQFPTNTFSITGVGAEKRFQLDFLPPERRLVLLNGLQFVLGFKNMELAKPPLTAPFKADLVRGSFAMFIYCDIVEHLMVGDSQAPLLRTTHLHNSEHGAVVNQVFNPAHYVRICKPHISVIEVDIRTDSGAPFPLSTEGKLILTLHFKHDAPAQRLQHSTLMLPPMTLTKQPQPRKRRAPTPSSRVKRKNHH
jgi:hypothetical protein